MFDTLSDRLNNVFDRLRGRGALGEQDVRDAMREVRVALLEADVALPVARDFIARVTERAVGQEVLKSVTPGQQVIKIVNDELITMLGGEDEGAGEASPINLDVRPPAVVMMVGLQGSGKTTSTAKIAKLLKEKQGKKPLMASLDVNRPAAQEQLAILGEQAGVATLPIVPGQQPVDIAKRALESAKLQNVDVLLLDTAGRLHVDEALMAEMKAVAGVSNPAEVLLVVDALTGQDAVNVAQSFTSEVPLTGVVLTRMDGDARGGAALSMRAVTGKPIKFAGTGEKLDAIERFHPSRVADRILGMGDVVSLVERAAETHQGRGGRGTRQPHDEGQVRPERPSQAVAADAEHGRPWHAGGHDARHEEGQGSDGQCRYGRQGAGPHGCRHLLHDEEGAGQSRAAERQAQEACCGGQRAQRAGGEQDPQDAPGNGPRHEADQEDGRHEGPCRHVRRRRWRHGRRRPAAHRACRAAECRDFPAGKSPRKCKIFSRRNKLNQEFELER